MGEQTLAELYAQEGWYLSPESEHYDVNFQDPAFGDEEAVAAAMAIYGPGVEVDDVNVPLTAMRMPVTEIEAGIVSGLEGQQVLGALIIPDELWMPGDLELFEYWETSIGRTYEGAGGGYGGGGSDPASAGLAGLFALLGVALVDILSDLAMGWLSDKIDLSGDNRALENAMYYAGRLVGYTGKAGEVYPAIGKIRMQGREM